MQFIIEASLLVTIWGPGQWRKSMNDAQPRLASLSRSTESLYPSRLCCMRLIIGTSNLAGTPNNATKSRWSWSADDEQGYTRLSLFDSQFDRQCWRGSKTGYLQLICGVEWPGFAHVSVNIHNKAARDVSWIKPCEYDSFLASLLADLVCVITIHQQSLRILWCSAWDMAIYCVKWSIHHLSVGILRCTIPGSTLDHPSSDMAKGGENRLVNRALFCSYNSLNDSKNSNCKRNLGRKSAKE